MQIADKLRKSLLQAAIQGKLTKQLPSDGDARELLAEIKREKARLVAEKKMNGGKNGAGTALPITDDELPFDIPENWCWVRIGQVFTLQAGKFISADNIKSEGTYPCYGGNGLRGYVETFNQSGSLSLIGRQGALCGNINVAHGEFYATEHAVVVQSYAGITAAWAAHFLKALNLNQYSTATAQPGLAVSKIDQLPLPLPPLAEQQRIVATIEALLPRIEALEHDEKQLAELQKIFPKQLKNALLQAAIQGKLTGQLASDGDARDLLAEIKREKTRLVAEKNGGKKGAGTALPITDDEMPFDIPENWCWVRLGEVALLNPRNNIANDMQVSFMPMVMLDDGYSGRFSYERKLWKDVKSGFTHFAEDDVVIAKITPCFQNRKSAVVNNLINGFGAGTTELHVVRPITKSFLSKYILWLAKTEYFISNGERIMTGTAGQQRIGKDYLLQLAFPLPPLAEQQRIVERLEQLLPLCAGLYANK